MRRAVICPILIAALSFSSAGAERKTWSKIHYVGGTIPVKASPFDYNTSLTVTLNPDSIEVVVAPAKAFAGLHTIRLKPEQITSLSAGSAAVRRVAETGGAQLPSRSPSLFGLLEDHAYAGIVYQTDDGKQAAILLDTYYAAKILSVLKAMTGKEVEWR